jgi:NAD(P)-dependent dehydrogenase (short-subunit alcohol dehydrogenase family)
LVTGGASGIGRAAVLQFATAGARVVVADVDDSGGAAVVAEAAAATGHDDRVHFVHTDVCSPDDTAAMVAAAVECFGRLDCALNNAGMSGQPGGIVDCPLDQWQRTLDLNLTSVLLSMRAEIPAMLETGGGSIVNTASVAGLVGFPALPAYVASKHGVVGLTRSAALEFVRQGIRVNAVCPGNTRTPMLEAFIGGDANIEKMVMRGAPIGRMATPDEIAAAAVWLCSDAASYVNGVILPVDSGASAG